MLDQFEDVRSCQPACAHQYTCCAGWVNRTTGSTPNAVPIIAGVLGGVLVLSVMLLVAMLVHRKRRRLDLAAAQAHGAGADKTEVRPARQPFIRLHQVLKTVTQSCPLANIIATLIISSTKLVNPYQLTRNPSESKTFLRVTFLRVPCVCPSTSTQSRWGGLTSRAGFLHVHSKLCARRGKSCWGPVP